jgi:hypothetical protein
MSLKSTWTRIKYSLAVAASAGVVIAAVNFVGCGTTTHTATYDPYLYTVYYPADVTYSTVYWTDDWVYTGLYATNAYYPPATPTTPTPTAGNSGTIATAGTSGTQAAAGTTGTTAAGGATGTGTTAAAVLTTAGDAIRALARGETICPNQMTLTPKTTAPACTGGSTRGGATIVFNGCQTPGGATLDGMVDITSSRTASTPDCNTGTTVTLMHTSTITNLSYTSASGARLVIPTQTGTGTTTYTFGQTPPTVALAYSGELLTYQNGGALQADLNYTGTTTFSFAGSNAGYTVDGGVSIVDNRNAGSGATATVTGLKRETTCCRPVAGMIQIVQSTGSGPGLHTWSFGPNCGDATIDGAGTTLPGCF